MLIACSALVGLVGITRLIELGISRRHRQALLRRGGTPVQERGFAAMVSLHTGILLGSIAEPLLARREVPLWFAASAAAGVVLANLLRMWSIASLGPHWNVRVVDSTALGIVETGPYRVIRHPNYVAVFLELLLLPLAQGAWLTAIAGSVLHVVVLSRRIALEESVLLSDPTYFRAMAGKPRFIPGRQA